jgi:hypothetical protein
MRFVSWGFVAACGFLLAGPAAKAAEIRIPDLPSPQYDWTGFYAGVYGGGAFAAWAADTAEMVLAVMQTGRQAASPSASMAATIISLPTAL